MTKRAWFLGLALVAGGFGLAGRGAAQTSYAQVGVSADAAGDEGRPARSARLAYLAGGAVLVGREGENDTYPGQQNMALAQGSRVSTGENGQAEIEFEDGSVVRLTPNSAVNLDSLGMDAGGSGYATVLRVVSGLVYTEMRASGVSRFRVVAGGDTFWPVENATVRVNLDEAPGMLSVLDGRIHVEHGSGDVGYRTDVRAGESVRSDAGDATRYFLSESVPPESWDRWNEKRDQAAADQIASGTGVRDDFAGSQGYGWSDLDANGEWYGAPGQTPIWQPVEAQAAGFDPYGYGSWTYFPGGGYTWASGYAWGWTPYRCGSWQYWNGFGWGWQPNSLCGSSWGYGGGLNIRRGPGGYVPIGVPVRRPIGVHPIVPGPHPGQYPGLHPPVRNPRQNGPGEARSVAGVMMRPIAPAGFGSTPRGGSAVGSSLRRDFPVDGRTHTAVMGAVGSGVPVPASPVSGAAVWRPVTTRPEAPVTEAGGGVHNGFERGGRPAGDSRRVDSPGSPGSFRRGSNTGLVEGRTMPPTADRGRVERSQPVMSPPPVNRGTVERSQPVMSPPMARPQPPAGVQPGYRVPSGPVPMNRTQPNYQPMPRMEQRSGPPPAAPAVRPGPANPR